MTSTKKTALLSTTATASDSKDGSTQQTSATNGRAVTDFETPSISYIGLAEEDATISQIPFSNPVVRSTQTTREKIRNSLTGEEAVRTHKDHSVHGISSSREVNNVSVEATPIVQEQTKVPFLKGIQTSPVMNSSLMTTDLTINASESGIESDDNGKQSDGNVIHMNIYCICIILLAIVYHHF